MGRLGSRLVALAQALHHDQYQLVITAAAFADSGEWAAEGATSAGAWLAATADVEACTAREWIRIGRLLKALPVIAGEFAAGRLSCAKVRTLTRVATTDNEAELAALARSVPIPPTPGRHPHCPADRDRVENQTSPQPRPDVANPGSTTRRRSPRAIE